MMTVKKRDTSKKRSSILDAAVKAFVELGYDKTSMDYVAELANASKRTVYNHFPSKELLFDEAFNRFLKEAFEKKNIAYDPERTIEDQLCDFANIKMTVADSPERLGIMRVAMAVFISHPQMAEQAFLRVTQEEDGFVKWLKAATADGKLKVEEPEIAAEVFWSMFSGTFFWPAIVHGPIKAGRAEVFKKEFIRTFLARYS